MNFIRIYIFKILLFLILISFGSCVEALPEPEEEEEVPVIVPGSYVPIFLQLLDAEMEESSGLAYFEGKVWTVNDSGNEPIIYQVDTLTGKAAKKVRVTNAENIDWESLAQSDRHLFVGDFGNNRGNRTDLVVLKILKEDILTKNEITAEKIFFSYPEQDNFEVRVNNHNFDCEAFFYADGFLHLFTKNWENSQTSYYTLGINPGTMTAKFIEQFNSEGLITGADINTATGDIVLIGYENKGIFSQSFIWLFSKYPSNDIFKGKNSKIMLGSPAFLGQTEAIFFKNNKTGFISSEKITMGDILVEGKLFTFNFNSFL